MEEPYRKSGWTRGESVMDLINNLIDLPGDKNGVSMLYTKVEDTIEAWETSEEYTRQLMFTDTPVLYFDESISCHGLLYYIPQREAHSLPVFGVNTDFYRLSEQGNENPLFHLLSRDYSILDLVDYSDSYKSSPYALSIYQTGFAYMCRATFRVSPKLRNLTIYSCFSLSTQGIFKVCDSVYYVDEINLVNFTILPFNVGEFRSFISSIDNSNSSLFINSLSCDLEIYNTFLKDRKNIKISELEFSIAHCMSYNYIDFYDQLKALLLELDNHSDIISKYKLVYYSSNASVTMMYYDRVKEYMKLTHTDLEPLNVTVKVIYNLNSSMEYHF
jgi:hypothetical protein